MVCTAHTLAVMHYAKRQKNHMKQHYILLVFFLLGQFSFAQKNPQFTFDLEFETNYTIESNSGESQSLNHIYRIEKFETSCVYNELEYEFLKNDTLLFRYFRELENIFKQPDFYRNFNKTCPKLWDDITYSDGTRTTFRFKSDSIDIKWGARNGICNSNSLYDNILQSFFNIALYVINQPASKGKISPFKLYVLEDDEGSSCSTSLRLIRYNPLTYRLIGRIYENEYQEVLRQLNCLSKENKTYIEVSGSYHTKETDSFYPLFKEFLKAPNKIIWIPQGDRIAVELKSMGVKKKNMKKINKKNKHSA